MVEYGFNHRIRLRIEAASDRGYVRSRNEDRVLVGEYAFRDSRLSLVREVSVHQRFVISIADGMGGQQGGDVASAIVIDSLCQRITSLPEGLGEEALRIELLLWTQQIHRELLERGERQPELKGMGTTLTGLLIYEGNLYIFNIGDSRIYRYRDRMLRQLTTDHTVRKLTGNNNYPASAIYNAVGGGSSVFIDLEPILSPLFTGDLFLLCSDGLYELLPDEEMARLLASPLPLDHLLEAAKNGGGTDNISLALVQITGVD